MASASRVSPSSSPRLPSPPPMAEDQISSPPLGTSDERGGWKPSPNMDQGASRRIRPGTRAVDMTEGPPLMNLTDIDSAFQLTEHLKAYHHYYTHPEHLLTTVPVNHEIALQLAQPPDGIDRALWLYELCRFLVQKVNTIITALFADSPPCSAQTCPEMRASEWQYLCAVHDPPKSCCAIDYCCHTLDWAANTLSSPKHFPSRLALGTEATSVQHQVRQLTNIFRRVYRIFAHAWFQHRAIFWRVEQSTGLYMLFKTVCDAYSLIPEDNYTIPPEAEGKEIADVTDSSQPSKVVLKKEDDAQIQSQGESTISQVNAVASATTKRHRQNPSSGAHSVTTVLEENEDEEDSGVADSVTDGQNEETITQPEQATEEGEISDPSLGSTEVMNPGEILDVTGEHADESHTLSEAENFPRPAGLKRIETILHDPVQTNENNDPMLEPTQPAVPPLDEHKVTASIKE